MKRRKQKYIEIAKGQDKGDKEWELDTHVHFTMK